MPAEPTGVPSGGQRRTIRRRVFRRLAGAVGAAALATVLTALPVFDRFHGIDTDLLHGLREALAPVHANPAESPVVVVAITPDSYSSAALSGIPRIMWTGPMAAVQRKVLDAGATVFAWDIILQNLAAPSLRNVVRDRVDLTAQALKDLSRLDAPLLKAMRADGAAGKVILGTADLGHGTVNPHRALIAMVRGARNLRPVNAYTDPDGVVRGVPLIVGDAGGGTVPGFALEAAMRHLDAAPEASDDGTIRLAGRPIPVFRTGTAGRNLIVNFDTGPGAIPTYAFHDLAACDDPDYLARHFAGRAVLFGLVEEFEDRKVMSTRFARHPDFAGAPPSCAGPAPAIATTARNTEAGVYLHAHAFRNLVRGDGLTRPGDGLRISLAFAVALTCAGLAAWRRPLTALIGTAAVCGGYAILATAAFRTGTVLPLLDPGAAGMLALAGTVGFRFVTADKERKRVRQTFSQYLDRKVIEAMIDAGDVPELGGESRELTCFFSDIEAFSSISEKMGPVELVAFLNAYFEIIGVEIEAKGGIIERFLGDAVCAVFGAPVRDENHAVSAVRCALAIDRGLKAAQDRFEVPEGRTVRTRIGINTGSMTAGNVGAERRKTYTVMGDAVNLAARLESVNKQYGTLLMAGDETVTATGDLFEWRLLDRVRVVGRATPVGLYEPLGERGDTEQDLLDRRDAYEAALALFQAGRFEAAKADFAALADAGDAASEKAVLRCDAYLADPPPPGWDGVTDLVKK